MDLYTHAAVARCPWGWSSRDSCRTRCRWGRGQTLWVVVAVAQLAPGGGTRSSGTRRTGRATAHEESSRAGETLAAEGCWKSSSAGDALDPPSATRGTCCYPGSCNHNNYYVTFIYSRKYYVAKTRLRYSTDLSNITIATINCIF